MRLPNDIILGEEVPEIDIILGGHDHNYVCEQLNNRWVVKSGILSLNILNYCKRFFYFS